MSRSPLRKILIIRLSSIGDIILTSPFLRVLKSGYPDCEVHFVTRKEYGTILEHDPHIDRLLLVDTTEGRAGLEALNLRLSQEHYDAVFDLHNNFRSRVLRNGLSSHVHRIKKRGLRRLLLITKHINIYKDIVAVPDRYIETAARYGVQSDAEGPRLYLTEDIRLSARMKLRAAGIDPTIPAIGICPGAKHFTKRWPAEHFTSLAGQLAAQGNHLLLFGGGEDHAVATAIREAAPGQIHDLTGRLTLLETAAAMEHCKALITNDSGLMHMATAMQRPVVALFGSTVREFGFFPYHSPASVLEVADLPCRPCTHIGRARCPKGHFSCMRDIAPESVREALTSLPGSV
ncbi:MAG: lipopolysaccharide heptosyltransferase II [Bacteroidetes bacterium]|nr:lipopolysaccharide heptosyltransferase II [Bacteroidota bacterium]